MRGHPPSVKPARGAVRLSAGGLALALCACGGEAAGPPPPLVRSHVVAPGRSAVQRFTGVVRARTESALGFRVGGKIAERMVDPGAHVRAGQPLMRLDGADLALALASARAGAQAARALMLRTAADERRTARLAGQGWVSVQGYEGARAAADAASAQLAAAEAQAGQIENQAGYALLKADADGVVMEVAGEAGQVVAPGQTVVKLAQDGPREAEIFLPEGREAVASADAAASLYTGRDAPFEARLREVSGAADPGTRTFRARYVLTGPGADAPLGATVTLGLRPSLRGAEATLSVPLAALFDAGDGPAVWRIDPVSATVSARPVSVARLGEESAEIAAGLEAGERIVALGAHLLKAGQRVRLAPETVADAAR